MPGIVHELEEREAARFSGYAWREWTELPREERAAGIAHFRVRKMIDLHQQDAQQRDMERKEKIAKAQAKSKGKGRRR